MDVNGRCGVLQGVLALAAVLIATKVDAATVYTVGDSAGWTLGVDYSTWASGKPFAVGDSLVFNYASSAHTVEEVGKSDYGTCTTGNGISTDGSGATTIPLKTAGAHYFICGVVGHCGSGMKLAITVASANGGSTVPTTPSGPAIITTSPPSSTSGTNNNCTGTMAPSTTGIPTNYYYPYIWSLGTRINVPLDRVFMTNFMLALVSVFL